MMIFLQNVTNSTNIKDLNPVGCNEKLVYELFDRKWLRLIPPLWRGGRGVSEYIREWISICFSHTPFSLSRGEIV